MSRGLVLDQVGLTLHGRTLVAPLSLAVPPGGVGVVMGDSGSGKSSLLAWLAGVLEPPLAGSGRISVDGQDLGALPAERRRLGLMLQDDVLFPHLNVRDNLLLALPRTPGQSRAERRAAADAALAQAELAGLLLELLPELPLLRLPLLRSGRPTSPTNKVSPVNKAWG